VEKQVKEEYQSLEAEIKHNKSSTKQQENIEKNLLGQKQ